MLAFIDESGLPNPKDPASRPVVAAVCFSERNARLISQRIQTLKRRELGDENAELKGSKWLNKKAYFGGSAKRQRADKFFATLRNMPVTVFAAILQAPFTSSSTPANRLERRFHILLQRIELLAAENHEMANIVFDGLGNRFHELGRSFSNYLFRSNEGRASVHIADSPLFADSMSAIGIQIADMCAYAIRVYHENCLVMSQPNEDYLRAASRWYRTIESLTHDFTMSDGQVRYGLHRLSVGIR